MCFDRRGRLHRRRIFTGAAGALSGFVVSAILYTLTMTDPTVEFDSSIISPGDGVDSKSIALHCFVSTHANGTVEYLEREIAAISDTWGGRCTSLTFVEARSETDNWISWWRAIEQGASKETTEKDWFVYTTLGTFVVIENVRKMVAPFAKEDTSTVAWAQELPAYSPAIVLPPLILSSSALKRFHSYLKKDRRCVLGRRAAHHTLASCLPAAGIRIADSRDDQLRHRMLTVPIRQFIRFNPHTYQGSHIHYMKYKPRPGVDCCSPDLVSVATMKTPQVHFYDYMLYKARKHF